MKPRFAKSSQTFWFKRRPRLKSEQLEIKGWCRDERELAEKVSEACACIANTLGGFVFVGVADGPSGERKFSGCPHPVVTTAWLQTSVHNLTRPPVSRQFRRRERLTSRVGSREELP